MPEPCVVVTAGLDYKSWLFLFASQWTCPINRVFLLPYMTTINWECHAFNAMLSVVYSCNSATSNSLSVSCPPELPGKVFRSLSHCLLCQFGSSFWKYERQPKSVHTWRHFRTLIVALIGDAYTISRFGLKSFGYLHVQAGTKSSRPIVSSPEGQTIIILVHIMPATVSIQLACPPCSVNPSSSFYCFLFRFCTPLGLPCSITTWAKASAMCFVKSLCSIWARQITTIRMTTLLINSCHSDQGILRYHHNKCLVCILGGLGPSLSLWKGSKSITTIVRLII